MMKQEEFTFQTIAKIKSEEQQKDKELLENKEVLINPEILKALNNRQNMLQLPFSISKHKENNGLICRRQRNCCLIVNTSFLLCLSFLSFASSLSAVCQGWVPRHSASHGLLSHPSQAHIIQNGSQALQLAHFAREGHQIQELVQDWQ